MSDLGDFLKAIADAKKEAIENNPGKKALKDLQESIQKDNPFLSITPKLSSIQEPVEPPVEIIEEEVQQLEEVIVPEVKPAAEQVPMDDINKYLKQNASFQQPNPEIVDPSIRAIQDKMKFMEQWLGKIAAAGPGSGEVNFRWLDDVNRSTMNDSNNNWVLEYDSATKKVQFTDDVGPIQKLRFNTTHVHDEVRTEGTLCWNNVDKTLDLTQNEVTQQIGQENFVLVRNRTGATITNGSFVRFSGAEQNGVARLLVAPFLGDGTYPNLFGLGVATEDIVDGADGFVTVFGKIRGLNTTNTGITSETWQVGDILYASPTTAGKLTRIKPTAPNNVIPVAAVLRIGTTNGELFIRPTYEQKRTYGTFADKTNQTAAAINTPYAVTFNTTNVANGHRRGIDTSHIISDVSGLYNYKFSMQFVSTNSSGKDVFIWFRKNGVDIPDSASRITITGNGVYTVAAWDVSVSMDANDYFQIMWAATDTTVSIAAPAATAFCPAIPSVILTVTEVAL